ncbi:NAD(P)-dependent oxidoreductase [Streptomyces sp. NPDC002078]
MHTRTFRQISILPGVWPSSELLDELRTLSDMPLVTLTEWPSVETPGAFRYTDALLAGWKDQLDAARLSCLPSLRYIGLRATSTDRIDLDYTRRHAIKVSPIHGYGDIGTVEFVVEQLLQQARGGGKLPRELAGRRLGLIGYGAVARGVGRVAAALGMDVVFHTPTSRSSADGEPRWLPLHDVLRSADFLSFHSPAYEPVVTLEDLRLVPSATFVVITTLGLPMAESDFAAWQSTRDGRTVMDLCTAHALTNPTPHDQGVELRNLYAARTVESVKRAEGQLIDNLMAAL